MHRRRGGDRAAARHRAEPDRDRRGVGKGQDHVFGRHLPQIGRHLGKDRLHALALRGGAARDVDLAGRVDADKGALERPDPGPFDVAADAEPEIAPLGARRALAPAERLDTADRVERLFEGPWVIAAVVDDRLAVAVGNADPVRHLLGPDHVAPAHLRRLQAERARTRSMVRSIANAASGRPAPR